ncbi:MAG: helix-turn-helix domain-containing protein, partial [Deltaproteobacteria bacterium]|nr:helix-turn-helix domain-containing protein [Deltaproteobacteria bacterium]
MRGYGQFCPIAQAAEVLAERWTLLVVRELLCGSERFGDLLKGVPLMPRSVLSARLAALQEAGVVERATPVGSTTPSYTLTEAGKALEPIVMAMGDWGKRFVKGGIREEQLDVTLLMWDVHRRIDHSKVPPERTVMRFEFPDAPAGKRHIWLALHEGQADVCYTNPGYDTDLVIKTRVRVFTEIWMG